MDEFIAVFVVFFSVIDPIGTVPVFIAVTNRFPKKERTQIAFKAAAFAALILLFFILVGEIILDTLGIPLPAFQIAGGIVLFMFALSMIFGDSKPDEEIKLVQAGTERAVFPLAVPSIASPGAMMAAVLLTKNDVYSIPEQVLTTLAMVAVVVITLIFMLGANFILRIIGNSGASIISRVMGLILASVAVANVVEGIKEYFLI